jgi:ATP-dependent Clp protease adapter protein ClpS
VIAQVVNKIEPEAEPKIEKPRQYNIIIKQSPHIRMGFNSAVFYSRTTRTLRSVFHLDHDQSHICAHASAKEGRALVKVVPSQDVAETLTARANEALLAPPENPLVARQLKLIRKHNIRFDFAPAT